MQRKVEVTYADGSTESLTIPSEEEFAEQDRAFSQMMESFFPDGLDKFLSLD